MLYLIEEKLFKKNADKCFIIVSDVFKQLSFVIGDSIEFGTFFLVEKVFCDEEQILLINALDKLGNSSSA